MFKPSINCIPSGGLFYSYKHRKTWLLLYYLDYSVAGAWGDPKKALHWINSSKYSIIDYISPQLKINDGYEFFLDYPEINKYVIWYQKNNPLYENKTCENIKVEGYIQKSGNFDFMGLYYSNAGHSLLDGSYGCTSGWYAVGRTNKYTENGVTGIPGPAPIIVNKTVLWIRVNTINKCSNMNHVTRDYKYILFLVINICR